MRKNKVLISLLALGVLSTSAITACDNPDTPGEVSEEANQKAADEVTTKLNALTDSSSEADVTSARAAFDQLSDAQKALVSDEAKLNLRNQEKRISDDKLVKEVVDAIAALSDGSSNDEINAVFDLYDNLDGSLKSKVTNIDILLALKARIDAGVVVNPVIEKINALSDTSSKEEVKAAEAAFLALTSEEKEFVPAELQQKLTVQLNRILQIDVAAVKNFIDGIEVEDLISDVAIIDVLKEMNKLDLSESVIAGLEIEQKDKLELLQKTTNSYEYAGINQAKSWRETDWTEDSYGLLNFAEPTIDPELNAPIRSFEVSYFIEDEVVHHEFGITLVGDSNLKDSRKEAVFYIYNPDIDTNLRIDYAKGDEESFCKGGLIELKHGWNRISISLNQVSDKNVINLMIGAFEDERGVNETTGWKISSFIKYEAGISGAIRTEYYRIFKILETYLENEEPTERNEYTKICEEYAKLSVDEKAKLPEGIATKIANDESIFKVADANALNILLGEIPVITQETDLIRYAGYYLDKLLEYQAQYNSFDEDQKALVSNAFILDGLEDLSSFKVLTDGSEKFVGWADYPEIIGPNSTTDNDPVYGTIQKITCDVATQQAVLFPTLSDFLDCDVVYFNVYCPSGSMEVLAEDPYWPYDFGTLEIGWNTVCIPVEPFIVYPENSIGLFLSGIGDWKFSKAIGFVNTKGAEDLVNTINGLTYTGESNEEQAIIAARNAYNSLGFASKTIVSNLSVLENLEKAVDQHYADEIINKIAALQFDIDGDNQDSQRAAIEAVRSLYEGLNDARKNLINNLAKLEELEEKVVEYYKAEMVDALKEQIEELSEVNLTTSFDVALLNYVKAKDAKANVYYLNEIDQDSKDKVEGVITAFESIYTKISDLTTGMVGSPVIKKTKDEVYGDVVSISADNNTVQALFGPSDNGTLENYDFIYVLLKSEVDNGAFNLWGAEWETSFQTFEGLVGGAWNVLKINTSSFKTGEGGSTTFNQLDFCLAELTNNHEVLMTSAYGFADTNAANAVSEQINALKFDEKSIQEEEAIVAAREAYNALGKGGKTAVTNYETLANMELAVNSYYVAPVISAINALEFNAEGTTQDAQKVAIEEARALYNALSETRKALVSNYDKLTELEAAVAEYYKSERLAALISDIDSLPDEITISTNVDIVMKAKILIGKCEAHDLYSELEQSYKDKLTLLKENIDSIYTTLLDGTTTLLGWDYGSIGNTSAGIDEEFGNVQKITFEDNNQHSLKLPEKAEYAKCDFVYISVYCPSGKVDLVNGNKWPYTTINTVGWNVIKVPGSVFKETYPTNSLGFLFNGAGEWKFGMVLGYKSSEEPVVSTEVIFKENPINSDLTNWAEFTEKGVDSTYGNYTILNLSEFNGTIQVIINGVTPVSPSQYSNVTFGIYNPTQENATLENIIAMNNDWGTLSTACGGTTLVPGWNQITFSSSILLYSQIKMLNIKIALGDSTLDGWKISEFVATKIQLELTDYHFGQVTDTGEDDPIYGNIYDLIQEQWFIDNPDAATMASIQPGLLTSKLPEGKTELVFKIYNPNNSAVNLHIAGGSPWVDAPSTISLAPKLWTEVSISAADIAITDVAGANYYFYIGSSNTAGWKVTDIFAK